MPVTTDESIQIDRIKARIGARVLRFLRQRLETGERDFTAEELRKFCRRRSVISPESPTRILRDLRDCGTVSYVVLCRATSLYHLQHVEGAR